MVAAKPQRILVHRTVETKIFTRLIHLPALVNQNEIRKKST